MLALLPVKKFASGKSRLAGMLSLTQRSQLTCHMLTNVIRALKHTHRVEAIAVVSNECGIDGLLGAAGVERWPEAYEGDLNRSLAAAIDAAPPSVDRVLILPSDVPAVCAEDIELLSQIHDALCRAHGEGIVLCPAIVDGGTNALLSSLPLTIALRFGERSLERHLDHARLQGVATQVIPRQRLARDIDRPDDVAWLASSSCAGGMRTFVRRLLREAVECEAV